MAIAVTAIDDNDSPYTVLIADAFVASDATSGAITAVLPAAATATGLIYEIKKIDASANAVTVDGDGAETIDGSATQILSSQYDSITVISDGTEWWIL